MLNINDNMKTTLKSAQNIIVYNNCFIFHNTFKKQINGPDV